MKIEIRWVYTSYDFPVILSGGLRPLPSRPMSMRSWLENSMAVRPVPAGFHTVTPYLIVAGASEALEFYAKAFGAKELMRIDAPGGRIGHAEIRIGDSTIMLADEFLEMGARGPTSLGGTAVSILLYVDKVDELFDRAVAAGAKAIQAVRDQFYGDRSGMLEDPFGHVWTVATHIEDVTPEEINRRFSASMKSAGSA